jgi:hypothetical protein
MRNIYIVIGTQFNDSAPIEQFARMAEKKALAILSEPSIP